MAAVVLSWQQPYTDRLQCWGGVGSGRAVAGAADGGNKEKKRETKKNSNILSDCDGLGVRMRGGGRGRQHNLQATCNFFCFFDNNEIGLRGQRWRGCQPASR